MGCFLAWAQLVWHRFESSIETQNLLPAKTGRLEYQTATGMVPGLGCPPAAPGYYLGKQQLAWEKKMCQDLCLQLDAVDDCMPVVRPTSWSSVVYQYRCNLITRRYLTSTQLKMMNIHYGVKYILY